jgi:cysteine desulfurase
MPAKMRVMEQKQNGQHDHAATTPTRTEVVEAMLPYFSERFGNPSSLYSLARGEEAVEEARGRVAAAIGASSDEVFFTSGGREADNWAIKGTAAANIEAGRPYRHLCDRESRGHPHLREPEKSRATGSPTSR